jgi:hypothetical protein
METKEIAVEVDRLDAFLAEDSTSEPEMTAPPEAQLKEADRSAENFEESTLTSVVMNLSPEQIDTAIERVINEKISAKIETIIHEVIEKAVSKEIDRLKGILLENDT